MTDRGVDAPDDYGKTALHRAAERNAVDDARALLAAGADIEATTSWGATPLDWAAVNGSSGVGQLLVRAWRQRPDAHRRGGSWSRRVRSGDDRVRRRPVAALDRGADVNAKGIFGATALHWALFNGHEETADLLRRHHARDDIRDRRFAATAPEWAHERRSMHAPQRQ